MVAFVSLCKLGHHGVGLSVVGADGIDGAGVDAVAEGPKIPKRGKSAIAGLPAVK